MQGKTDNGQATRQHVLTIATRLFAKSGYDETSIEDVLSATELSRGALYYHFASKEKLFEAVLENLEAEIAVTLKAATRGMADLRKSLNDKGEAPAEAHRAFDLVAQANRTAEALRRTARVLGRTVPA